MADQLVAPDAGKGSPVATRAAPLRLQDMQVGHWTQVFSALGITGVTRNVAANSVLTAIAGSRLTFVLDPAQSLVFNEEHQQRWQAALSDYFAELIELEVRIAVTSGRTPAQCRERRKAERFQAAVNALEQDDNVQMLQQRYNARLLKATVKPLDDVPGAES